MNFQLIRDEWSKYRGMGYGRFKVGVIFVIATALTFLFESLGLIRALVIVVVVNAIMHVGFDTQMLTPFHLFAVGGSVFLIGHWLNSAVGR